MLPIVYVLDLLFLALTLGASSDTSIICYHFNEAKSNIRYNRERRKKYEAMKEKLESGEWDREMNIARSNTEKLLSR